MVQNRVPDSTEQLCLISPDELRRMRRFVPRPQKGKAALGKACRGGKEHVDQKDHYIQDALPGL